MKKVLVEYEVYRYNELSENSKRKSIRNKIEFIIEHTDFDKISHQSNLYRAYKECEEMKTPWFLSYYIWDYCLEELESELENYLFLQDGIIFNKLNN